MRACKGGSFVSLKPHRLGGERDVSTLSQCWGTSSQTGWVGLPGPALWARARVPGSMGETSAVPSPWSPEPHGP